MRSFPDLVALPPSVKKAPILAGSLGDSLRANERDFFFFGSTHVAPDLFAGWRYVPHANQCSFPRLPSHESEISIAGTPRTNPIIFSFRPIPIFSN